LQKKDTASALELVVSPEELHSMLDSKEKKKHILVVDARPFSDYAAGHVPGAVNIDLMQFHWIDTSREGIAQFNRQSMMLLSNIGVSKDKLVVFYDDQSGPSAARGVWLLLYFSHDRIAMLDGGFGGWKSCGYDIEKKTNPFVHANFEGRPNKKILAGYADVKAAVKKKDKTATTVIILDARSKEEYEGTAVRASRAGHVPGAVNIDWRDNLAKDALSFKSRQDLERVYAGIPKDAEVIAYCQGGYRAANSFVALRMLGYKNVKMYLGSWGEWGNMPGLPVETRSR
jgi:thiosulfate/3-mercaptopyruvate sulfurtransferase